MNRIVTGAGRDVPLPHGVEQGIARWDAQRIADQRTDRPASDTTTAQTGGTR